MSKHRSLADQILEIVRCEPQCDLDELILSCRDFPWYDVLRELAWLQRAGKVTIISRDGDYTVRPSSQTQETRRVRRDRLRRRRTSRAGVSTTKVSTGTNKRTVTCQPR